MAEPVNLTTLLTAETPAILAPPPSLPPLAVAESVTQETPDKVENTHQLGAPGSDTCDTSSSEAPMIWYHKEQGGRQATHLTKVVEGKRCQF